MAFTISLRVGLLLMVLIVAIVAAAVSFGPLYVTSIDSATNSGTQFSESISREIVTSTARYFGVMQQTATVMVAGARLGGWSESDVPGITRWMNYGVTLGADSINMIFDGLVMWTAGYVRPDNTNVNASQFVLVKYNMTYGVEYIVNTTDLTVSAPNPFVSTLNFRTRQYYPVIRAAQAWAQPFIGVSLGVSEAVLPCGAPIVLPNGTAVGGFYVRTRAKVIVDYFRTIKVAQTGRAMLIDPATQFFVASNSLLDPLTKVVNGTVVVTSYTDVADPLSRRVVSALGSLLITCLPMPCAYKVGSGDSLIFVTVSGINDTFNLNKRVIVMIPSDDFLGDVRTSAKTSLGAAAGAVVGLLLLSVVAVMLIVRPLERLEEKLNASATLEDGEETEQPSKSIFSEILNIEEAYDKLQAELKKVKSFLPQSILKQLEGDDDEEDEGELMHNHEASVTSMESSMAASGTNIDKAGTAAAAANLRRRPSYSESHLSRSTRQSSRHSKSSGERSKGGLNMDRYRALNTTTGIQSRACTIVMANLDNTHDHIKAPHELLTQHTKMMKILADAVNDAKGILDSFHGDHFTFTFNSSTNCASHCTKSAWLILRVREVTANVSKVMNKSLSATDNSKSFHHRTVGCGVRFGIATGKALCGNFGTDKIKRFCTVGPVVNHAASLLTQCRTLQVDNLISEESQKGINFEYVCASTTIAVLPHEKQPSLVYTVRDKRESKMDEWMYELQEGEKQATLTGGDSYANGLQSISSALTHLMSGEEGKASQVLDDAAPVNAALQHRWDHVQQLVAAKRKGGSWAPVLLPL